MLFIISKFKIASRKWQIKMTKPTFKFSRALQQGDATCITCKSSGHWPYLLAWALLAVISYQTCKFTGTSCTSPTLTHIMTPDITFPVLPIEHLSLSDPIKNFQEYWVKKKCTDFYSGLLVNMCLSMCWTNSEANQRLAISPELPFNRGIEPDHVQSTGTYIMAVS